VSRELFASALKLARNRDLVDAGREQLRAARAAFALEVGDVADRVAEIERLDAHILREALDADG
jgi:glycerol-3-phosphate O-acyltransferase